MSILTRELLSERGASAISIPCTGAAGALLALVAWHVLQEWQIIDPCNPCSGRRAALVATLAGLATALIQVRSRTIVVPLRTRVLSCLNVPVYFFFASLITGEVLNPSQDTRGLLVSVLWLLGATSAAMVVSFRATRLSLLLAAAWSLVVLVPTLPEVLHAAPSSSSQFVLGFICLLEFLLVGSCALALSGRRATGDGAV